MLYPPGPVLFSFLIGSNLSDRPKVPPLTLRIVEETYLPLVLISVPVG